MVLADRPWVGETRRRCRSPSSVWLGASRLKTRMARESVPGTPGCRPEHVSQCHESMTGSASGTALVGVAGRRPVGDLVHPCGWDRCAQEAGHGDRAYPGSEAGGAVADYPHVPHVLWRFAGDGVVACFRTRREACGDGVDRAVLVAGVLGATGGRRPGFDHRGV